MPAVRTVQQQRSERSKTLDMSYLESTVGFAIRRAQMAVFADIFRAFEGTGITIVQFSVLATVADNPGLSQADLALALSVERPRMVPIIDALEQRGLAIRIPSQADARFRDIALTAKGQKVLRELKQRFAKHQTKLLKKLDVASADETLAILWRLADGRSRDKFHAN